MLLNLCCCQTKAPNCKRREGRQLLSCRGRASLIAYIAYHRTNAYFQTPILSHTVSISRIHQLTLLAATQPSFLVILSRAAMYLSIYLCLSAKSYTSPRGDDGWPISMKFDRQVQCAWKKRFPTSMPFEQATIERRQAENKENF